LATTKIDELKNGKRRPAPSGEVAGAGRRFSIWPSKAPVVQAGPIAPAVAAPGAIAQSEPAAAGVAAAKPAKRSWMSFIFGKKEPQPAAAAQDPVAPSLAGTVPPAPLTEPVTAAQAQTTVAGEAAWTMDPAVPIPLVPGASGKLQVVKRRGWSPLGFLGLGADQPAPVQVAKAPAQAGSQADGAALAAEPVRPGNAVPSTDDINVEKDTDGI